VRILVIEDEPTAALAVANAVRSFGHEAVVAGSVLEAWDRLQAGEFRIVISDWMMPGEDGLALCRRIRATHLPFYAYVIILTGRASREDLLEALSAGADDFLGKPLDTGELRVRLLVAERIVGLETSLREANETLHRYAVDLDASSKVDTLMRIGNRAAFEARLREMREWAREGDRRFAIVMCDVDHFKVYNDSLGHQRGDQILRQVADAVRLGVRDSDQAFRYGGEEIVLVLPELDMNAAAQVAERVRCQVQRARFELDGSEAPFSVTISCGVAAHPGPARSPADGFGTVEAADRALYAAKRRGRNCVARADELDQPPPSDARLLRSPIQAVTEERPERPATAEATTPIQ
jgi:diguanylate cyclase (GGDEF)-like protein